MHEAGTNSLPSQPMGHADFYSMEIPIAILVQCGHLSWVTSAVVLCVGALGVAMKCHHLLFMNISPQPLIGINLNIIVLSRCLNYKMSPPVIYEHFPLSRL